MRLKSRLPQLLPWLSALFIALIVGVLIAHFNLQPYRFVVRAIAAVDRNTTLFGEIPPFYYATDRTPGDEVRDPSVMGDGAITLLTVIDAEKQPNAVAVDREGAVVQDWGLDLFGIWGDFAHLPDSEKPRTLPGTNTHGALVMENGDLVTNFSNIGTVRVNACGAVVWKLARMSHHSLAPTGRGTAWAPVQIFHEKPLEAYPSIGAPFSEETAQEIDLETGAVVREISIFELLAQNGLPGLLRMGTLANTSTNLKGDLLHLNDIEEFPEGMEPGAFAPGDLLISLRNIHSVLVVDPETLEIRFLHTGGIVRQHDPDFESGDTITVFDNNNVFPLEDPAGSRIVRLHTGGRLETLLDGTGDVAFFSTVFGKQQRLEGGGLLFNEGRKGRALEVDADGRLVWEYVNHVGDGLASNLTEAQRLPPRQDAAFFAAARAACE